MEINYKGKCSINYFSKNGFRVGFLSRVLSTMGNRLIVLGRANVASIEDENNILFLRY